MSKIDQSANFKIKLRERNISEDRLIEDLKRVSEKLASQKITAVQYAEYGQFGVNTIRRKFGSWNNALEIADLGISNRLNIPNEELFENLANVWQAIGRQPVGREISELNNISRLSLGVYEKRFGSWNKALIAFSQYIEDPEEKIGNIDKEQILPTNSEKHRTPRKINWRLRAKILIRDNCICCMCGASPAKDSSVTLHVNHIQPWSKGGETETDNLQTLCSVCNIGKSDEIFEF